MPQIAKRLIENLAKQKAKSLKNYISLHGIEIKIYQNIKKSPINPLLEEEINIIGSNNQIRKLSQKGITDKIIFVNEDNGYITENEYSKESDTFIFSSNEILAFIGNTIVKTGSKIILINFGLSLVVKSVQKKDTFSKIHKYKLTRYD